VTCTSKEALAFDRCCGLLQNISGLSANPRIKVGDSTSNWI